MAGEAKKAQEAEFKAKPWKDPKKKWDQAFRKIYIVFINSCLVYFLPPLNI